MNATRKKIIIEISGVDINELDPDSVTEAVYEILDNDGYDVTVVGSIQDG